MLNIDTSKILDKEMNRKQFLRNIGIGVIAFTGLAAAIRAISQTSPSATTRQEPVAANVAGSTAYGSSVYGGKISSPKS